MKATLGVRELVLDGELSPGDRVPEIALAQRLGVSRTPLRLALTTLAHEGLLESLPGGGFVVRSFTRASLCRTSTSCSRTTSPSTGSREHRSSESSEPKESRMSRRLDGDSDVAAAVQVAAVVTEAPAWPAPEEDGLS